MSHEATNWAFTQADLKPGAKLVLLALADCHNPLHGCFPSHEYLAKVACMSERSVRDQLDILEEKALIYRIRANSGKGRAVNRYILGFEPGFTPKSETPTAKSAGGENNDSPTANSDSPTAKHDTAQRQNLPPNLVKEPVKEPVCGDAAPHTQILFTEFWENHPRPRAEETCLELFTQAVESGVDPHWIVSATKDYAQEQEGNGKQFVAYADTWLSKERWKGYCLRPPAQIPKDFDRAEAIAARINGGKYVSQFELSTSVINEIMARKLVTAEDLKKIGVRV